MFANFHDANTPAISTHWPAHGIGGNSLQLAWRLRTGWLGTLCFWSKGAFAGTRKSAKVQFASPHLYRVGEGSNQVLWPGHKVSEPKPTSAQTKGASRINRALLHAPGLPTWSHSGLVGQCCGCLRHLLSSYWPAQTTAYTEAAST